MKIDTQSSAGSSRRVLQRLLCGIPFLSVGLLLGWLAHDVDSNTAAHPEAHAADSELGTPLNPGPWGSVYSTTFQLTAPDEILPVRALEEEGTVWLFPGKTSVQLRQEFDGLGMPADLRSAMLCAPCLTESAAGCELRPSVDQVFAIPSAVRPALYQSIARHAENRSQYTFIHHDKFADRFKVEELGEEVVKQVRELCCEHGDYLVLAGLPALLSRVADYDKKVAVLRGLTRQTSVALHLKIEAGANVEQLAEYWGRGMWSADVRSILSSVADSATGGWLDVSSLLPPLPSAELYFFPKPENPLTGPVTNRDCHWTAMNFFNDTANPDFGHPEEVRKEIADAYLPATGDPRYGDVLMFAKPNGEIIHSAVFIADQVVFTKNGAAVVHPWVLSTIPELMKQYSFQVEAGGQLAMNVFRKKAS